MVAKRAGKRRNGQRTRLWVKLTAVVSVVLALGLVYLDATVRYTFAGKKWAIPAVVYARPLELFAGAHIGRQAVVNELDQLGYRRVDRLGRPGDMVIAGAGLRLYTHAFRFADGAEPARRLSVSFSGGAITGLSSRDGAAVVRLNPLRIGSIYPAHNEDRLLVQLKQVPSSLVDMLITVEDRHFYQHHGISFSGIARAFWANVKHRGFVQGGSTLTQQLVKNYYLNSRRTLWRKGLEAVMAVLLELHFSKDEILEGYINEVYLGQDGPRSINGFGLASEYYFNRPLPELSLAQQALLVAMIRGPSYYNPWRHPERARARRNLVLDEMVEQNKLSPAEAGVARSQPLGVGAQTARHRHRYPAYLDLVRRQLARDYREKDLSSEGLRIFTNFDPQVQWQAEHSVESRLAAVEHRFGLDAGGDHPLEAAVVVAQPETGAVLAVVGGRNPRFAGFDRALDAHRPVGSLIKPAVYLTALEQPKRYTWATLISDGPVAVEGADGSIWRPDNFDRESHGDVMLYTALTRSYNLATARLGMTLGIDQVIETAHQLGLPETLPAVPSLLLGAVALTPLDMSQFYQTIAAGGFYTPLAAIRAVTTASGEPLNRYPLDVEQRIQPDEAYLLRRGLRGVAEEGTAKSLDKLLPPSLTVAGKTGTSDSQRDSWFAGFSGDLLTVVWVGRDDNGQTPLTGATGALPVWADIMAHLARQPLALTAPKSVEQAWIDRKTGLLSGRHCEGAVQLPFIDGSAPDRHAPCAGGLPGWLKRWFDK